jgi:hypothetical protein
MKVVFIKFEFRDVFPDVPVDVSTQVAVALLKLNGSDPILKQAEYVAVTPPVSWFGYAILSSFFAVLFGRTHMMTSPNA